MEFTWFSTDIYRLLVRMSINIFFLTIIIRFLYYPIAKRKDYLFTYYLIGFITFFICFALKKLDIDTGMGLGLFAIFGIIRYRTDAIEIKEMTYLFIVIGLSVINSLASNQISMIELGVINVATLVLTYSLEYLFLLKHETRKNITYENIELIKKGREQELKGDIENRTGITVNRLAVGKIDFLSDTANVTIYYFETDE
ncbi:DUF4956 domain-containing protein [Vicingaceae bacterium]|nr:DUF4956 domain-containing protein [Vicingaceae bacterium]MDB4062192.1 DUF4956 domain-containing protein [Vicingaceae bacterium]MDC1451569.1 DUF4956 domain-containing protein [Vicingaceae bacterium]